MNKELIQKARQADLKQYLESRGTELEKVGLNRWQGVEHDSLVVSGNRFVWNSRGIEGNTLDYLLEVEGVPFKEAVERLTGESLEVVKVDRHKRVLGYLCKTRGIDYKLASMLIQAELLDIDDKSNCVFNIMEYGSRLNGGKGKKLGGELHGTYAKRPFKGFTGGQKSGTGYNIGWGLKNNTVNRLYAFESAIDLLSFITLVQNKEVNVELNGNLFLSMGGLKPETINAASLAYNIKELVLCVDRDAAGNKFIESMKDLEPIVMQPPEPYKDWNDRLTGNCG